MSRSRGREGASQRAGTARSSAPKPPVPPFQHPPSSGNSVPVAPREGPGADPDLSPCQVHPRGDAVLLRARLLHPQPRLPQRVLRALHVRHPLRHPRHRHLLLLRAPRLQSPGGNGRRGPTGTGRAARAGWGTWARGGKLPLTTLSVHRQLPSSRNRPRPRRRRRR